MKIIFVIFAIFSTVAAQTNYCQLCINHVACNNTGNFGAPCPPDAFAVQLTDENKMTILDAHNEVRNKIAGGNEPGFSTATKMNAIVRSFNKFILILLLKIKLGGLKF
jgi:hypothetical protein